MTRILLRLCNDGDLYEALAIQLCGSARCRENVKSMFLTDSYGMTATRLADYLTDLGVTRENADDIINARFIPLFTGIENWKISIQNSLSKTGKIETLVGSHRYRRKSGDLDAKERR